MAKQKALQSSLDLFAVANGELRDQVDTDRQARHDMRADFDKKIADERAECAREMGRLQGQVSVLTQNLGRDIAAAVLQAFKDGQASMPPFPGDTTTVTATTHTAPPTP